MFIEETYHNATAGYNCGDSGVYEAFTDDLGELYRALVRDNGRCIGKVYVDYIPPVVTEGDDDVRAAEPAGRASRAIGWIFQKRTKYEDCDETFLLETWVTLHEKPPTVLRKNHYFTLDKARN